MATPSDEHKHPFKEMQRPSMRDCVCGHHALNHNANVVADLAFPGMQGLVLGACHGTAEEPYCECSEWQQAGGLRR